MRRRHSVDEVVLVDRVNELAPKMAALCHHNPRAHLVEKQEHAGVDAMTSTNACFRFAT
jgi:hypothetical protein